MHAGSVNSRHEARERALQVLYAVEIGEHNPRLACDDLLNGGEERYIEFARQLVLLTVKHREEMNELIRERAQKWDLDRIALIDRLVLRLALSELFHISDVPPKVTINEAIEIAKAYSTDQSGRFINGILDALFNEYEEKILDIKSVLDKPSADGDGKEAGKPAKKARKKKTLKQDQAEDNPPGE